MKLRTGANIPSIGLGTWQLSGKDAPQIIRQAITKGYRHLDCAAIYGNEAEIGKTLKELFDEGTISRSDLFITSKLWCTMMDPGRVQEAAEKTLSDLQCGYLDLYLIHWPMCFQPGPDGNSVKDATGKVKLTNAAVEDVWIAMNKLVELGKVKAVGVSNFTIAKLDKLIKATGLIPAVNQVELHPYLPQEELLAYCKEKGILVEAYSPLGSGRQPSVLEDPTVVKVANDLGRSPAQVLLGWANKRGTVALAKTSKPERLEQNLNAPELPEEAFNEINSIPTRHRFIGSLSWTGHDVFSDS